MKVLTIVGARPQFVKAAALSRQLKEYRDVEEVIIHTGQHFDTNMSDVFFAEMELPKPDYTLNIHSLPQAVMTGRMMEAIEPILQKEQPDWVVVYGDTNSTLAGALTAKKLHYKVAHVEAGLRSFNMQMPEEVNRILTDRISDLLFCPTSNAVENLKREGFDNFNNQIKLVGDIMEDTAKYYQEFAKPFPLKHPNEFILLTIHRAENTNDAHRLKSLFKKLDELAKKIPIVCPLHPRTEKRLAEIKVSPQYITCIEPIGYLEMLWLLQQANLVITDSGGLQKEAYFFDKYCITLRTETEWTELVDAGYNFLEGIENSRLEKLVTQWFGQKITNKIDLYGGGSAAKKIIDILLNYPKQIASNSVS